MIKTYEELNALREKMQAVMGPRLGNGQTAEEGGRMQILVCGVAGCLSTGSLGVYEAFTKKI